MGHRKYSTPRRGSIAFRPRARAQSLEARIRTWPENSSRDNVGLVGFAGFKVGQIQVMTIDDKEKTPNYGKPLMNHSTVISLPPLKIVGIRGILKMDMVGTQYSTFMLRKALKIYLQSTRPSILRMG